MIPLILHVTDGSSDGNILNKVNQRRGLFLYVYIYINIHIDIFISLVSDYDMYTFSSQIDILFYISWSVNFFFSPCKLFLFCAYCYNSIVYRPLVLYH